MFRNGRKNKIHNILIITIAAAVCAVCIIFFCIRQGISWFQACGRPSSEVSLLFIDPTGQEPLSGVQVGLIRGHDKPDGKSSYQAVTGEDGSVRLEVPSGEYTIRWQAEGYYGGYQNITTGGEAVSLQKRLLPYAEGISAYILLEWEGEEDLDLCVYDEQNDRYIGRVSDLKSKGSRLYADDDGEKGYELVYLKFGTTRNYIIYVKDGDSIAQNYESSMEQSGVTVSIYTENGLLYQKKAEAGETSGLWKCAFLCKGEVAEQDEYIYDLTDYAWAERDKHNPDSWAKESDVKVEEVYYYAAYGSNDIERTEYDDRDRTIEGDHRIAYFTYDAYGHMNWGFRKECAYDKHGNWLTYIYRYYEDGVMTFRTEYQYDEYGNRTLGYTYDQNGMLTGGYRQENSYDVNGNLISQYVFNDLESPQTPSYGYEWEYDAAGNIVAASRVDAGLLEYQYTSEWSADGRLLRDKEYGYEDGELESWEESEYDAAGNQVRCYYYNEEDKLEEWEEYEYDASGNRTAEYIYTASGKLLIKTEMEYDEDGRKILSYTHNFGNMAEKEEWEYGAHGEQLRIISRDYNDDGIYEWRKEVGYNTYGNITFQYDYRDGVMISGHRNEYDHMGNEIRTDYYQDGIWDVREYKYEYDYDAVAGMLITDWYKEESLQKRTITIYR